MQKIQLNEQIIIESSQEIPNHMGGYKTEWEFYKKCWAAVISLFNTRQLGHEVAFAKEVVSSNFYQFTVRFNNKLNTKMRIIWRQRTFEISKIIDTDTAKRFMQIVTQEVI